MSETQHRKSRRWHIAIFLAPAVLVYSAIMIFPLFATLRLSLYTETDFVRTFVGLENFRTLFGDPRWSESFWNALLNNGWFFLVHMLVQNPIGVALAAILSSPKLRFSRFYRSAIFIPTILSFVMAHFCDGSVYKSYAFMACSFSNQRDRTTMDHKQFQDWLSGIDHLSPAQRQEAETVFMGVSEASSSLAAIEASVGESRQCPHCGTPGAISRGKARGLRRYQCKGCNKTFNAATGTPLSGLHRKDKWLAFGTCLSDGLTVRASAERCKFAVNTAFRWRHRFLTTDNPKARKLTGIVEVDETYVLQSQKGERNLERKARRRGGKARKRGLSDEQVPVLVAADRSGMTVSAVLPAVNADTLQSAIEPVVDDDIVLVTDGHRAYPPCAAALGVRHEALNLSGGERVRDAFHIQTVNNRHSQLKDFLRRYRGVATKYLDNYLRWFQRLQLENASPRACRATAIADPCIRFVN